MDLPAMADVERAAAHVVAHLAHQGAEAAMIVAVTHRIEVAARLVRAVEGRLGAIRPVVGAWADGERFWTTADDSAEGHPYETSAHHVAVVQAIAAGQEILPDRAALAAKLQPVAGVRRVWLDHAAETVTMQIAAAVNTHPGESVADIAMVDLKPGLAAALARRPVSDGQALRLAVWATVVPARDALFALITPDSARDMVGLWSHVARCAPPRISAPSLCLAGYASWLSGNGALALIAAERAMSIDRDFPMAGLLLSLLEAAVPPSAWRPFGAGERATT
jgi:hypothetical protein